MKSDNHSEMLFEEYRELYSKNEAPEGMFKLRPAIPFVGKRYQDIAPKILSYASAENLSYAYDENLEPNDSEIHQLESSDQFNRAKYFYNKNNDYFPNIHIEPFNNGCQLLLTRHIVSKLGYEDKFENQPYEFIEQIAVANPGKFSIASKKNSDYANNPTKMNFSIDYIKADLSCLKPQIIIIPKTVFETINKIINWSVLLKDSGLSNIDFIQFYQLSFFNNNRIKKAVEKMIAPNINDYLYGKWLEKINCGKVDVFSHFSWIDNHLYKVVNIKSS